MSDQSAPFWGPPTSYLNFCEEDYAITRYIGEFINTLSSLSYVIYGIYALINTPREHRTGPRLMSHFGLMGVGICSGAYHMTLKYHTQMMDELSMHLLTTPLIYRLLTFQASPRRTAIVGTILSILFTIVMVTHMVMDEFVLHAVSFGTGVWLIGNRTLRLIPQVVPDKRLARKLWNISVFGCACFGFGYTVWLTDEFTCGVLTDMRRVVGLPLGFLLELHGWWHFLTAIGGYVAVGVIDLLTTEELRDDPTHRFAWPVPMAMSIISARDKPETLKEL